jgi:redox-sensitive bicupin YhaK (pirin superfamily)
MATLKTDKYWIQVVLGELGEVKSKVETNTPAFYYHVKMEEDAKIEIPTKPTDNVFIYQISGSIELEGQKQLDENQVALFNRGESLVSIYSQAKSEFLVLGGTPLDETVFSYGPFVMNNEEQIRQCMINYQNGLMGDPNEVNR